jgi:hypothetical protein
MSMRRVGHREVPYEPPPFLEISKFSADANHSGNGVVSGHPKMFLKLLVSVSE